MNLNFQIPVSAPLKSERKKELIEQVISSFEAVGISDVEIADSFYLDLKSDIEPLAFVLIVQTIADLLTIALAIKHFLKKPEAKNIREFRLKTDSESIVIKGEMTKEDIIKIIQKVKKIE